MEELAAQQAVAYEVKYAAAVDAMEALRKATPWSSPRGPRELELDRVREYWREQYAQIADILQTSPQVYEQAMFREANLIAPCKTVNSGKHKTGARDAAIWLTAIEYAKAHPSEKVYFISNNTADFGDGSEFPPAMAKDLDGLEDRFALYTSVDGVVEEIATEVEVSEEEVRSLLKAQEGRSSLAKQARRSRPFTATVILNGANEPSQRRVDLWINTPAAVLSTVGEISGYEIDGHKWCTATARWLLSGRRRGVGRDIDGARTYAAWTTRVLLSTTAPEKGVTVLRARPPVPLTDEETASIPKDEPLLLEDAAKLANQASRIGHLLAATQIDPEIFRRVAIQLSSPPTNQEALRWLAESLQPPDADLSRIEELLRSQLSYGETETLRQAGIELLSRLRERELDQPDDE